MNQTSKQRNNEIKKLVRNAEKSAKTIGYVKQVMLVLGILNLKCVKTNCWSWVDDFLIRFKFRIDQHKNKISFAFLSFFWIFHQFIGSISGGFKNFYFTAFEHGGRNFSPALLAATAFHFVTKCDLSGVASRQILLICLITCIYFAGATLRSCYQSVADGFWFHFVLNVFCFVISVVIVIVGFLHSITLGKIRDFHGVTKMMKGAVGNKNDGKKHGGMHTTTATKINNQNNQQSNNYQNNQNNSFQNNQNNHSKQHF